MEVIDAYWRKRKQRIGKMLEDFQKTGWKTGGKKCVGNSPDIFKNYSLYLKGCSRKQKSIANTKSCVKSYQQLIAESYNPKLRQVI